MKPLQREAAKEREREREQIQACASESRASGEYVGGGSKVNSFLDAM